MASKSVLASAAAAVVAVVGGGSVLAAALSDSDAFRPMVAPLVGGAVPPPVEAPPSARTLLVTDSGLTVSRGRGRTADEVCFYVDAIASPGIGAVGCDSRPLIDREGATFALSGQGGAVFHVLIPPAGEPGVVRANGTLVGTKGAAALVVRAPSGEDVRFEGTKWDRVSPSPR